MNHDYWHDFVEKCSKFSSVDELNKFFEIFLTISEREEFAKRYSIIVELLNNNKTQRELARDLKVSIANVSRGANVIKVYNQDLEKIFKKSN